ncbi:MAG: Calx-beta domain-containing protein [Limisphaerales bacterium]
MASENGAGVGLMMLTRFGNNDDPLTVYLDPSGSAVAGRDYVPLPASVTIPAGARSVNLPVMALDNLYVDGNRTVLVTLRSDPTYQLGASSATVTILGNDPPVVTIDAPEAVASKNLSGNGTLTVTRTGSVAQDLEVNYLISGSATSGIDYAPLSGSVTIRAGSISTDITVTPLDNRFIRGSKTVSVYLSSSPAYDVGTPNTATVVIEDSTVPTVNVVATVPIAVEPNTPGEFTVTRTGNLSAELVVNFEVGGVAIPQARYAAIGNNVRIPAGADRLAIPINPIDDPYHEDDQTIVLKLIPNAGYNIGPTNQATVTLQDDDNGALPYVGFTLISSSGPESLSPAYVTVMISAQPAPNQDVVVDYRATGGTAVEGVDFTLSTNNHLTFTNGGPTILDIPVRIIDNQTPQPDRTIMITLLDPAPILTNVVVTNQVQNPQDPSQTTNQVVTNLVTIPVPTNAFIGVYKTHTYTILDDDLAVVTIMATDPSAVEAGPKAGRFTVSRVGPTNVSVTVNFQVTGTASSGTDFVPIGNSLTIPAGTNAVDIPVVPIDDRTEELPETVKITLIDAPGARIGSPDNATVFIQNVDGTIEFATSTYSADENAGNAVIAVQRTGDTNAPVTVDYATSDGTATAGADYVPVSGTLSFAAGETLKSFSVPIVDDTLVEANETINLTLRNPTGGVPLGGQSQAVLSIIDNDTGFVFASADFRVNENGTNAIVTVQRIGVATNLVTVDYATSDGTAAAGVKYVAQSGTLSFGAGETAKTFPVPILDNTVIDGDQTVTLTLTNPTGGASLANPSTATLTIVDDDCALAFDTNSYSVLEYAVAATLNVRRIGGTVNPVRVDFTTRDGTARQGSNYVAQSGTLSFAGDAYLPSTNGTGTIEFHPGETNKTIFIPILDNAVGNGNQTFYVLLSNATGPKTGALPGSAVLGQPTNAAVTIIDDEAPGFVDYQFDPRGGANDRVLAVAVEADGRVVIGGEFTAVDGINFNRLARLHANGYLDSGFNPGAGADGPVYAIASQPDGKVLLGGAFTRVDATNRSGLARLNADGSLDLSFDPGAGANDAVRCVAVQPDNQVLFGGDFTGVNGTFRNHVARLNADGSVDGTFATGLGADGPVYSIALQTDGKVVVAGAFTSVNGVGRGRIARLNADGSLDAGFDPGAGANGPVYSIAVQADDKVLLGGAFSGVNGAGFNNLTRLNTDGSVDASFDPGSGTDGAVYSVATLPDGRVFIGGAFASVNGGNLNKFARLNNDGSIDTGFNVGSGANGTIFSVAAQPDSALLIGGEFTLVNGLNRPRIARIHGDEEFTFGVAQFNAAFYQVSETNGAAVITVQRTGNLQAAFNVDYTTSDGTAAAGVKYLAQSGTLSFAAGDAAQTFSIPILNENTAEGNETVNLTLSNPTAGGALGNRNTAVLVIIDDESAVAFALPDYSVQENAGTATVVVERTGNTSGMASVDYATHDGTATAGLDYLTQSGTLTFGVGETNQTINVPILDDQLIEANETILVALSNPTGGLGLGSQSNAVVTIVDNDTAPRYYTLTMTPNPGGTVAPPSGQYPTNSVQVLTAVPDRNYDFIGWEGSFVSTADPLFLRMDQDYSLSARFRVKQPTDPFESGDLNALPWTTAGDGSWFVESSVVADGRFAVRSGLIGDNQRSSLLLAVGTEAGTGSFDFRVSSEAGWDFLEFYVNGLRLQRWSGEVGWQSFQFSVPAGTNRFEWRYVKDANFSAGLDAAFLDNVFVPLNVPDPTPPAAVLDVFPWPGGGPLLRLEGQSGRNYAIEFSTNLSSWSPLSTNLLPANLMFLPDPLATNYPLRFYRAVTLP